MAGKFEVYQDRSGRWRWRLKAANGQVVAIGEDYESRPAAMRAIEATRRAAGVDETRVEPAARVEPVDLTAGIQVDQVAERVWRVGYAPEPWAWPPHEFAGRERWDDPTVQFRTMYAGANILACFLEVLAQFRADPVLADELDQIVLDIDDLEEVERSPRPGQVPHSWLAPRRIASAQLKGTYCAVSTTASIVALRPLFREQARSLGSHDFDAAALKDAGRRELTQAVATHLHATRPDLAGIAFRSRHGDEHPLWAVFERPDDPEISPHLTQLTSMPIAPTHPALVETFELFGLTWARGI
ncbi:DUF1508 domain-containing protein [Pimelobacter sp. 30-1]|uniref:YegP family protein n=1 Tax=Pimelobacter sp. 30-1 TaxID=2004991 RepID=UPI001C04E02C|nr:DUF1508 domain-containing protein [Pimelobacter sp. 30-1]MBU2698810.1 hypothetical protein [Pimelobacter sp. 30-1]